MNVFIGTWTVTAVPATREQSISWGIKGILDLPLLHCLWPNYAFNYLLKWYVYFCLHLSILKMCWSSIVFIPSCLFLIFHRIIFNCKLTHLPLVLYMHQWIRSALVQITACCLFGTKPLSKPTLVIVNWTIRTKRQWNFNQNTKLFIHAKCS